MLQPVTPPQGEHRRRHRADPDPVHQPRRRRLRRRLWRCIPRHLRRERHDRRHRHDHVPADGRQARRRGTAVEDPRRDRADRRAPPRRRLRTAQRLGHAQLTGGCRKGEYHAHRGKGRRRRVPFDLRNLSATDGGFGWPNRSIQVRRLDLAHGRLRYDGDHIVLEAFDVPQVVVGELSWRIGDTGRLSSVGGATITNVPPAPRLASSRTPATASWPRSPCTSPPSGGSPPRTCGTATDRSTSRYSVAGQRTPSRGTQRPDPHGRALATRRPDHGTRRTPARSGWRSTPGPAPLGRSSPSATGGSSGCSTRAPCTCRSTRRGRSRSPGENLGAAGKVHVKDLVDTEVETHGLTLPELKSTARDHRARRRRADAAPRLPGTVRAGPAHRQPRDVDRWPSATDPRADRRRVHDRARGRPGDTRGGGRDSKPASSAWKPIRIPQLDMASIVTTGYAWPSPGCSASAVNRRRGTPFAASTPATCNSTPPRGQLAGRRSGYITSAA